jgi:hypothetical protein
MIVKILFFHFDRREKSIFDRSLTSFEMVTGLYKPLSLFAILGYPPKGGQQGGHMVSILVFARRDSRDSDRLLVIDNRPNAERLNQETLGDDWHCLGRETQAMIGQIAIRLNLS